jgi:glycosyltransferase involved in cell wall biosynthesis
LEKMPDKNWRLTVAGSLQIDESYVRTVRRHVALRGLTERVTFLGSVSGAVLAETLKESHLLVMPSSYEGFGIVYLEGMGFGLPAVASTAGAAREIITPGENGLLITPGDTARLTRHLQELAEDRNKLLTMSLEARRRYLSHPTWQMTAERVSAFLRTVLEKWPAPGGH